MTLQRGHVRRTPLMAVMATPTTLPLNKIVRITVEWRVVRTEERYGRNQTELQEDVPPTDNVQVPITVLLSPLGRVPSIKQSLYVVHPRTLFAVNREMWVSDVLRLPSLDITLMLTPRPAKHLNIMAVKVGDYNNSLTFFR